MTPALDDASRNPGGLRLARGDWLRALERTASIGTDPERTLPKMLDELAVQFGDRPALLSDVESLSFRELAQRAHVYSQFAAAQRLRKGDVVALLMHNRPEYMAVWLGLTRVGVVVALINTNLVGASLAHCLTQSRCVHAIVDARLEAVLAGALPVLDASINVWIAGDGSGAYRRLALDSSPGEPSERLGDDATIEDRALLIFTSGTTGLPKAANVSHRRILTWSLWFAGLADITAADRMYNCLPMYHSVGGVVATGSMLVAGGAVAIGEKFSAGGFWDDVIRWDCNCVQYIGELCRYLTNAPAHPGERAHRLRLACGNGLSPEVWEDFRDRFAVPRILEFYAATEGAFSLFNVEGKPGSIGRVPGFLAHRFPAAIVKHDAERGIPARDGAGRCIPCAPDEPGEAIGRLSGRSGGRFEGYTDEAAGDAKVLRDVFAPGDSWFRTGDLLRVDREGFYYFVDRVGDTFRWKGENVATAEVTQNLLKATGVRAACVYGVQVPGFDGRAGMAALAVDESFDFATLREQLGESLPAHARPLFLRVVHDLPVNHVFKVNKQTLAEEGFDPSRSVDPLYVDERTSGAYVRLDRSQYSLILSGHFRL